MPDLFPMLEADFEYHKRLPADQADEFTRRMFMKDKPAVPGEARERAPWREAVYEVELIDSKLVDNRYFKSAESLTKQYGDKVDGQAYWLDPEGKKIYADDEVEKTQYQLTFEVVEGEKQGDYLFVFSPHYFAIKKDGELVGKRGRIAHAMFPDRDFSDGIESDNSDLKHGRCLVAVQPKDGGEYAKVTSWLPLPPEKRSEATPATDASFDFLYGRYSAAGRKDELSAALGNPASLADAKTSYGALSAERRLELAKALDAPVFDPGDEEIPF